MAFYPVVSLHTFLSMLSDRTRTVSGLDALEPPRPTRERRPKLYYQPAGASRPDKDPRDKTPGCFGFSLNADVVPRRAECSAPDLHRNEYCECTRGYYSHTLLGGDGTTLIKLIVLDTTRKEEWGQWAALSEEQLAWAAKELADPAPTVRLVFMHHRVHDKVLGVTPTLTPLAKLLRERARDTDARGGRRPLVVFTAHAHSYETVRNKDDGFWEINMGSLTEYPQWASLVDLRRTAAGTLYLAMRGIRPALGQSQLNALSRKELETFLENCRTDVAQEPAPSNDSPPDQTSGATTKEPLLVRAARCGFAGAVADKRHLQSTCDKRQEEAAVAEHLNVVLNLAD